MKIGMIIYSTDAEVVWNAFRIANHTLTMGDSVSIFLIGQGVKIESVGTDVFQVDGQVHAFLRNGGKLLACKTCLDLHNIAPTEIYRPSTLKDLYDIIQDSEKVLTF